MTTAADLRAAAVQAERDAVAALDAAIGLERHHALLAHRLTPVLERHTAEVWASRAATTSRLRLQLGASANLDRARAAVLEVAAQVRRRADILEIVAADYRRAAVRLEVMAADAAAAAAVHGIEPVETASTLDSSSVPVPFGAR